MRTPITSHTALAASRRGFTLVEVLLTLVIMSGIMVSMTQILTAARTSRDTIHNIQETQNAGPAILDLIERDLRGMLTYAVTRQSQLRVKNRVVLGFDADSIDFVSTTDSLVFHLEDDRFLRADANEVGYRLRPAPGSADQFLEIYRRESYGVDDDPFEGGDYLYLHDRVKGFDVQCFAKDGPDEQPLDEWNTQRNTDSIGLPARIEITLTLELAPRITNEQLRIAPTDKRTVVYKRILRMPESLRIDEDKIPIAAIPKPPNGTAGANGQPNAGNTPMEVGGPASGLKFKGGHNGGPNGNPLGAGNHGQAGGGARKKD
jgi:prepilin-type N-terminal cleavage/methylation domain-containing protein